MARNVLCLLFVFDTITTNDWTYKMIAKWGPTTHAHIHDMPYKNCLGCQQPAMIVPTWLHVIVCGTLRCACDALYCEQIVCAWLFSTYQRDTERVRWKMHHVFTVHTRTNTCTQTAPAAWCCWLLRCSALCTGVPAHCWDVNYTSPTMMNTKMGRCVNNPKRHNICWP